MRKEISLNEEIISILQKKADRKKWSLKRYMEVVLEKDAQKNNKVQHNPTDECSSNSK